MKFTVHTQEEQANLLALKFPNGRAWRDKYAEGSVFRNLLIATGLELSRTEQAINNLYDEVQLNSTEELIREHEIDNGIPGGCFANQGTTIEERIYFIKQSIALNGVSLAEEFEAIGASLNLDIDVIAGIDYSLASTLGKIKTQRNTIVVDLKGQTSDTFTYTFTFVFGTAAVSILKCIFDKIKPANVQVVYINE